MFCSTFRQPIYRLCQSTNLESDTWRQMYAGTWSPSTAKFSEQLVQHRWNYTALPNKNSRRDCCGSIIANHVRYQDSWCNVIGKVILYDNEKNSVVFVDGARSISPLFFFFWLFRVVRTLSVSLKLISAFCSLSCFTSNLRHFFSSLRPPPPKKKQTTKITRKNEWRRLDLGL